MIPCSALAPPPAANTETFHYHVSLSPTAALGRITAHLAVVGKDPSLDDPGASAIVTGEVRGRISATPEVIAFGSVTQGTARQQQVLLSVPAELVAGLSVETSSPELTATLVPQRTAARGNPDLVVVTVTLAEGTPAGPVEGTVIVHDSDGERLVMPVYGVVLVVAP